MTNEEAEALLAQLSKHYAWRGALGERLARMKKDPKEDYADVERQEKLLSTMESIEFMIQKSSLLGRILYGGEKLRTEMCPVHEGRWSGCEFPMHNVCPHKCELTGWVKHPDDVAKIRAKNPPPEGGCAECVWQLVRSVRADGTKEGPPRVYWPCAAHLEDWLRTHAVSPR